MKLDASLFFTALLQTTPILLCALGGAFTQLANILNIALEGMLLGAAFAAVAVGAATQSALAAVAAAVLTGLAFALLFALLSLKLRADFIVAGIGINLLADGVTVFLLERLYHNEGNYSPVPFPQLWRLQSPLLAHVPVVGPVLNGQSVIVFVALALVVAAHWVIYHTPLGLRIRAVGENPQAAQAAGIHPERIKFLTIVLSGLFSGLGGAQLAMATLDMFVRGMSNGRGYIALAAITFGGGTPLGTSAASFIFGLADAVSDRLQSGRLAPQFVLMIPYLVTIVALVAAVLRARAHTRRLREAAAREAVA